MAGWRFRRSVKILPGVRLNFGKRGLTSTTVGGKFFKTNISKKGTRNTFSLPGTGLSYQGSLQPFERKRASLLSTGAVPTGYLSTYSWTCPCGVLNAAESDTCETCGTVNLRIGERNEQFFADAQAQRDLRNIGYGVLGVVSLIIVVALCGITPRTSSPSRPVATTNPTPSPTRVVSLLSTPAASATKARSRTSPKTGTASRVDPAPPITGTQADVAPPRVSSPRNGLIRGPRGGCYYINSNSRKTYVDRSLCN
jgi:hypothetical protein